MKSTSRIKMKKKDFEKKLYDKHGLLEYRPYDDFDHETHLATRLYLYYKKGKHIGTWCKGECWEFVEG